MPRLRAVAKGLSSAPRPHLAATLRFLAASDVSEARSVAGYAAAWYALAAPNDAALLIPSLIRDDDWTVREAATFGIREALITDAPTVLPLIRPWADRSAGDRAHRAFMVAARQPRRQSDEVMAELVELLTDPLSDDSAYVRKNVPFCLRYLARTHPHRLAPALLDWARTGDCWLVRSCVTALTPQLLAAEADLAGRVVARLRRTDDDWVLRRLP